MRDVEMRRIAGHGVTLNAALAGDGPLIVLVHGFPESWRAWRHQIGPLVAAGYRVCALECRGYGDSDRPEPVAAYDMQSMTGDIAAVARGLGGGAPAILIGHDWGAALVWHTALTHPDAVRAVAGLSVPFTGVAERALVDVVKPYFADRGKFFYQDYFQEPGRAEAELEADTAGFVRRFYYWISGDAPPRLGHGRPAGSRLLDGLPDPDPFPAWLPPEEIDHLARAFARGGLRGPLNRYRNQHRDVEWLAPWRGARIEQPALYIGGDRDPVLAFEPGIDPVARMRTCVPLMSDAAILPGCGHWTQQERPEAVTRLLLDWLAGLPAA